MTKRTKAVLAIVLALAVVVTAGVTYAWFTATAEATGEVDLGRLKIAASYDVDPDGDLAEPGITVKRTGRIENTGSLAVFAKPDLKSGTVRFVSDANGDWVTPWEWPISDLTGIDVNFDLSKLEPYGWVGEDMWYWWVDTDTEELYISIDGQFDVELGFRVTFDGSLGNEYQGARVQYAKEWNGTQVLNGATQAMFGVTLDNLLPLDEWDEWIDAQDPTPAPFSASSNDGSAIRAHFEEMFLR